MLLVVDSILNCLSGMLLEYDSCGLTTRQTEHCVNLVRLFYRVCQILQW